MPIKQSQTTLLHDHTALHPINLHHLPPFRLPQKKEYIPKKKGNRAISRQSLRPFPQPFLPPEENEKKRSAAPKINSIFHSSFDITIPRFMERSHEGVSRGDAFIVNVCIFFAFILWKEKSGNEISSWRLAGRGGRMFGHLVSRTARHVS